MIAKIMKLLIVFAVIASPALAVDPAPAPVKKDKPLIRYPKINQVVPSPVAPPTPPIKIDAVPILVPGVAYAIDSDIKLAIFEAPEGYLKIKKYDGPITIYSKFIDSDEPEARTFDAKFVYLITSNPPKDGKAVLTELFVLPVGDDGTMLDRMKIIVQLANIPPPPKVDPKVDPVIDPLLPITGFRAIFIYETNPSPAYTKEQLNILNSTAIAAYLTSKCVKSPKGQPEWRRFDKDLTDTQLSKETDAVKKLWAATKPKLTSLPAVVVVNDTTGELVPLGPNATEAEVLALLKKYGGN